MSRQTSTRERCLVVVIVALLDCAYLLYHYVDLNYGVHRGPSACNIGGMFDCDKVAQSEFSEILGVPVASYGLLYYLLFLFILLFFGRKSALSEAGRRRFGDLLFAYAFLALPSTIWFAGLSLFVVGYICIPCSILYLANLILCVVTWRDPWRSAASWSSFVGGLRDLFGLFLPYFASSHVKSPRVLAVCLWGMMLLAALAIYYVPQALVTYVFMPDPGKLTRYLEEWLRERRYEIPVNTTGPLFERDFSFGSDHAPLTIIEFSDFECPACKQAASSLKSIVQDSKGKIRLVFKNYPLDKACNKRHLKTHKYSCQAAVMARCAGMQGADNFWKMHDALFDLGLFGWNVETLFSLPEELGLDVGEFEKCMANPDVLERVRADVALGDRMDLTSTPSLYVKGKKLWYDHLDTLPGVLESILEREQQYP